MRIAIIGAGPTGLFLGAALARRGHDVTAVDRDPGPGTAAAWRRRGVMQFHHAHGFRPQVVDALRAELPDALAAWIDAGGETITMPLPNGEQGPNGMRSRRETFERALRATVLQQDGLTLAIGHVDAVSQDAGRADGLRVTGRDGTRQVPADLVIDASGRSGRATTPLLPPPAVRAETGIAYVDRVYQLRPGAEPGPMLNPLAWQADLDGYLVLVFMHERGYFSVLITRPVDAPELLDLRHNQAFEAACSAIPGLADWTDPQRARPVTPVLSGGALINRYQEQPRLPGLVLAGDATATTTPIFGRGIATSFLQAQELLRMLDEDEDVASFGAWCDTTMRPWVEDHARMDAGMRRRWAGEDVDLTERLPSDLILAASQQDPEIAAAIGPYLAMTSGPDTLDAVEEAARAVYRTGWRPAYAEGPDRAELCRIVQGALAA